MFPAYTSLRKTTELQKKKPQTPTTGVQGIKTQPKATPGT
jgi:hypothetical protein